MGKCISHISRGGRRKERKGRRGVCCFPPVCEMNEGGRERVDGAGVAVAQFEVSEGGEGG